MTLSGRGPIGLRDVYRITRIGYRIRHAGVRHGIRLARIRNGVWLAGIGHGIGLFGECVHGSVDARGGSRSNATQIGANVAVLAARARVGVLQAMAGSIVRETKRGRSFLQAAPVRFWAGRSSARLTS